MIEENEYNDLIKLADKIKIDTKAKTLLNTINSDKDKKFLIFTEFYSTQDYLSTLLTANGYSVTIFNGKMNLSERENSINNFRAGSQIMISTSAGGEGQNFQFCNNVVNYDLPWNPMRVEQRVGRVHRIGQKNDVFIYNYAYEKTIDAYILELLYAKIKLFTMSIGDLDLLFEDIDDKKSESMIFKEFMNGKSDQEVKNNLTALGNNWKNDAQSRIEAVKKFNAEVFDNFALSTLQASPSNA
jgi:SNF2 family DNA or RNA helicase